MAKKSRQTLQYLHKEQSFLREVKKFFNNFKGLSVAKTCLGPESAPLTLFVGWILFAVCRAYFLSIIVPLVRYFQIRVLKFLERLQKISHLYQMILLPCWQSVHEVRNSQTKI